ncbi:conserved Plasmodium protein, unknown function [Plasmodium relictum]|uniref:Uncharacterized protein n=1 Tax=Plasmodium relictum TaxID=85471 RepID=A0A1J1HAA4_PLARL|nr:conserved Plasmodium protein, unknown function [Plasmodium relictum]CRH01744.1 conserved Plasmodium protein, unknown function [Plasmodium relictum]
MNTTQNVFCSYCNRRIKGISYNHMLWKSYKICIFCKNNLKSCFSCEKKIKKNIDKFVCCTCGSTNDNLCEECRKLPVICCDKNLSTFIAEILYFLDYYLDIIIPRDFILFQNIYTFNKINFNEMNHCCTFEFDSIKNNKIDTSSYYINFEKRKLNNENSSQYHVKENYSNTSYQLYDSCISNLKNKIVTDLGDETRKKKNGIIRNFFSKLKILKKKEKNNENYTNETKLIQHDEKSKLFTSLKSTNIQKEKLKNKNGTKIIILKNEKLSNLIKKDELTNSFVSTSRNNLNKNEKKENMTSSRGLSLHNTTEPLFEYLKKLRRINKSKRKSYDSIFSTNENNEEMNYSNIEEYKIIMEKYNLNFVLYFMNRYNENEMYTRLLNNELKYYDILYLNNVFKNKYNETTVASCGCVTITKKKLLQMHEQNKRLSNYKFNNINLEYISMYYNESIKLIDHFSLTDSLPKISFFFFISHELMHTYLWVSKPKKSKYFEQIYQIVKKLHDMSFFVKKQDNSECHKNLSFYLSPELEEAICIYVSIEFIQHIKKVLNNYSKENIYEKELINYYIQKYEKSKSLMYGTNFRALKKIIHNYKIKDIINIIHDIYLSKFYPIITFDLLKAVISLINFKL